MNNLNLNIEQKVLSADELLSLKGGDPYLQCCLWCFDELMYCGSSGTGSCDGMINPDPENCTTGPA